MSALFDTADMAVLPSYRESLHQSWGVRIYRIPNEMEWLCVGSHIERWQHHKGGTT